MRMRTHENNCFLDGYYFQRRWRRIVAWKTAFTDLGISIFKCRIFCRILVLLAITQKQMNFNFCTKYEASMKNPIISETAKKIVTSLQKVIILIITFFFYIVHIMVTATVFFNHRIIITAGNIILTFNSIIKNSSITL